MERNVEEIITYMSEKFRQYEVFNKQLKQITSELIERGYTLEEITRGVNAYLLQLEPAGTDARGTVTEKTLRPERSFRVLDSEESRWIGPGAYGYMCLLRELGLLNHQETEEIIHYIVDNEIDSVTGEDLQQVILEMIFDSGVERISFSKDEAGFGLGPFSPRSRKRRLI
ncbi:MAG: DUF494 family protein [Gemmatimonadota bacterium]|nr:DUF494 family protein [Gemmatimonadota bacterium]